MSVLLPNRVPSFMDLPIRCPRVDCTLVATRICQNLEISTTDFEYERAACRSVGHRLVAKS